MVEALAANRELLLKYGGHFFAAGFTFKISDLAALRRGLALYWEHHVPPSDGPGPREADAVIESLSEVDHELMAQLALLEPHGNANERPRFAMPGLILAEARPVGAGGKHLKLTLADEAGERLGAIAFGQAQKYQDWAVGTRVTAMGELDQNEWQGVWSPQLIVRELVRE